MSAEILVVEYEPRYADRVRQALTGHACVPAFARDGEEALRLLASSQPRLIVLSSVIPKVGTADLVRAIRAQQSLSAVPILLTVSGYNGKSPQVDAQRLGATDILPKPYSESEFVAKVNALLGLRSAAPVEPSRPIPSTAAVSTSSVAAAGSSAQQLTSSEIFGDLVDEQTPEAPGARKVAKSSNDDLDKMLADTLSGVRVAPKKKTIETPLAAPAASEPAAAAEPPAPRPAAPPKPKSKSDLDRLLDETLSGIDKNRSRSVPSPVSAPPQPPQASAPVAASPKPELKIVPPAAPVATVPSAPPAPPNEAEEEEPFPTMSVSSPIVFPKKEEVVVEHPEDADGVRFGQYILLERIANGGMAEVWKARMRGVEGFQKIVAIKKILPHLSDNEDFITMFVDEAKLAAQLNHNNIIHIYDLGKIAQSYYIAMEYIDGHDLKTILKRGEERGSVPIELAVFVASKIASALDYAHRKRDFNEQDLGLVHRDVSPQNVLISYDGDIKLCDFGIAKAASKASHTQAGALKGKLQYMSPEQAWGRPIDRRSDVFALAVVLFEMLAGRKLFTGDNEMSILEQVREARVEVPSQLNDEVPPEVDAIVAKGLQRDPDQRYQSAGEMARDLDAVLYQFRPTPTSADLAIFMHRLYAEDEPMNQVPANTYSEVSEAPLLTVLSTSSVTDIPSVVHAPMVAATAAPVLPVKPQTVPEPVSEPEPQISVLSEPDTPRKLPIVPIAVAAVALLAIAGFFLTRGGSDEPVAAKATPAAAVAGGSAAGTAAVTGTAAPLPFAVAGSAAPAPTTVDEGAMINEEVARRLATERARLEQQRTSQQVAATTSRAPEETPRAVAEQPAPAAVVPQAVTPPPQVAENRPEPPPPQPAPVQQEPAPSKPAAVREGELVEAGTPGLVSPELARLNKPSYPPLAKMRKVEGIVVMSALISETGRVLDVKILRGVSPDVGINDAARQALLSSTFRPATKDGVRVKAYKTITIPFKL